MKIAFIASCMTVVELIQQGVTLNTTRGVYQYQRTTGSDFENNYTEKAIKSWALKELNIDMDELRGKCTVLQAKAYHSLKKRNGILMRKKTDHTLHMHWNGEGETNLAMCSNYYTASGIIRPLDKLVRKIIQGVRNVVNCCQHAGVKIKMITIINISAAKMIATECGKLRPNQDMSSGEVIQGEEFRRYTQEERMMKLEKIHVMASSSPSDKLLMVICAKQKGHVVAVTGNETEDAVALKEADIGLSVGIEATEVEKESSDIVILDDNFDSVATIISWGRCVYNNIQKFIQFQLTVNVAARVQLYCHSFHW
ncbi:hypothetical protein Dsin_029710 [Dipteronia sinensis]|uniref:Uncharacterized protein n=1 Tax=Dipteronia sinensis TaxID=43782 RepID=A0AAE0DVT5_9ROSI|nr:hypothetical protein Dsin_029710 [Dipteronia sinensis]